MTVPAFFGVPGLWGVMGGSSNKAAYLQVPGGLLATPAGAALCWCLGCWFHLGGQDLGAAPFSCQTLWSWWAGMSALCLSFPRD